MIVGMAGCLTSQQHASVSGRIYSDNCTYYGTEIEAADQIFSITQSQYADNRPTSPRADPMTPGAWQDSHWRTNSEVPGMTGERSTAKSGNEPRPAAVEADAKPLGQRGGGLVDGGQTTPPSISNRWNIQWTFCVFGRTLSTTATSASLLLFPRISPVPYSCVVTHFPILNSRCC